MCASTSLCAASQTASWKLTSAFSQSRSERRSAAIRRAAFLIAATSSGELRSQASAASLGLDDAPRLGEVDEGGRLLQGEAGAELGRGSGLLRDEAAAPVLDPDDAGRAQHAQGLPHGRDADGVGRGQLLDARQAVARLQRAGRDLLLHRVDDALEDEHRTSLQPASHAHRCATLYKDIRSL